MRTEDQLRTALLDFADLPHATDDLYDAIIRRARRQPVQRRRVALVIAVAAVLIAVAIAVPTFLVNRTGVPADQRVPGNWNQIHRVDLPAGWPVRTITVTADSESSAVGPPTASPDDQTGGCVTTVYGRGVGDPSAGAVKRTPVEVNGRPGTSPSLDSTPMAASSGSTPRTPGRRSRAPTGNRAWTSRSVSDSRSPPLVCPSSSGRFPTGTRYTASTRRYLTRRSRSSGRWTRPPSTSARTCPSSVSSSPPAPLRSPNTSPAGRPTRSPGSRRCSAPATLDCA